MESGTTQPKQKKNLLIGIVAVLAVLALVLGVLAMRSNPRNTLDDFLAAVESQNEEAAMALVSNTLKDTKRENIEWFVEDWVISDEINHEFESDESWRSQLVYEETENGEEVVAENEYGYEEKEIVPTPWIFAHHYEAEVTVTFSDGEDEYEDPVRIKLKRDTDNTWGRFAQLFRPWKITNLTYQPLDDEDFEELEFGEDEFIDLSDLEGEELELEVDENGELLLDEEDIENLEENTGQETDTTE